VRIRVTEKTKQYYYTIEKDDENNTIKELLKTRLGVSSRLIRKLKIENSVCLNGIPIKMYEKGKKGDQITFFMPEEISEFPSEHIPLDIIYEDSDLLGINKQPGYVVHPTKGHPCHTIANGIMWHMLEQGDSYKIRFINRLDMDTSGVLLVGKNSYCQHDFFKQTEKGKVVKKYIAIVKGIIEEERGTIDLPIGKPIDSDIHRAVIPDGYPSITHFRVMERFNKEYTLIELTLETGRTHQIRVHMAHLGYPIVGDNLYGNDEVTLIERHALHAVQLDFNHPITNKRISLKAPLPSDILGLLYKLR
jgi:23S rRNA pseudouridine1911/1915/1917 synthase